MKKWFIKEKVIGENLKKTAGVKARDDIDEILLKNGYTPIEIIDTRSGTGHIGKIINHMDVFKMWIKATKKIKKGDVLVVQYPIFAHSIFLPYVFRILKKRGVTVISVIHDVESTRFILLNNIKKSTKYRIHIEENMLMGSFSKIIVHNRKMKQFFEKKYHLKCKNLINLNIFDYLNNNYCNFDNNEIKRSNKCIIAGNLAPHKAKYVYNLPNYYMFELYGPRFDDELIKGDVHYNGAYEPDELVHVLKGDFGLVWDGESVDTCSGIYGEYLKLNNPHKTSLYLSCGIPVMVWDKAAIADFILKNKCGVTISSLNDISTVMGEISDSEYKELAQNARKISKKLVRGYYTKRALNKAIKKNCL